MAFVLDASVTITWAMVDEEHPVAELAAARVSVEKALVPAIWQFEVLNVLLVNEKRQRANRADSEQFLLYLEGLAIEIHQAPNPSALLNLAGLHRLTIYDAAYLELAIRKRVPLATLDKALRSAAEAAGVVLLG